jgi:WhiB family redox-sensing transcriptional regulator
MSFSDVADHDLGPVNDLIFLSNIRPAWQAKAACRGADPHLFYPERGSGIEEAALAKATCARCDVREDCLEMVIKFKDRYGTWGGFTGEERRKRGWVLDDELDTDNN